jgi:NADH-quinone oxidoreductase subunit A
MQDYAGVLAVLLTAVILILGLYAAHLTAGLSRAALPVLPYVGGSTPPEFAVSRFHARWYAMTMVFLAFDIEMLFMYPWTLVVAAVGVEAVVEMFVFLVVLLLAVVYAWREGAFRWT